MKFIVQRVLESSVSVDGETIGKIGKGYMVLIVSAMKIQKRLQIK